MVTEEIRRIIEQTAREVGDSIRRANKPMIDEMHKMIAREESHQREHLETMAFQQEFERRMQRVERRSGSGSDPPSSFTYEPSPTGNHTRVHDEAGQSYMVPTHLLGKSINQAVRAVLAEQSLERKVGLVRWIEKNVRKVAEKVIIIAGTGGIMYLWHWWVTAR